MRRPSPRFRSEEYIVKLRNIRRNVLPRFVWRRNAGARLDEHMAVGNHEKDFSSSFASKA